VIGTLRGAAPGTAESETQPILEQPWRRQIADGVAVSLVSPLSGCQRPNQRALPLRTSDRSGGDVFVQVQHDRAKRYRLRWEPRRVRDDPCVLQAGHHELRVELFGGCGQRTPVVPQHFARLALTPLVLPYARIERAWHSDESQQFLPRTFSRYRVAPPRSPEAEFVNRTLKVVRQ
jgi:hypothetical protein